MYLIYPDSVFVVLDLCKIFMACSFSLVPENHGWHQNNRPLFSRTAKCRVFYFMRIACFDITNSKDQPWEKNTGWMVCIEWLIFNRFLLKKQYLIFNTNPVQQVFLLHGGSSPKKTDISTKKKSPKKDPPQKSLHKLYLQKKLEKNEGRTRNQAIKKLPHKKLGVSHLPFNKNRGHVILPTQTVHSERKIPTKWQCNLHSLGARPWFPPQNMANYIEFLRIQVKDLPGISLIIKNHNK